MKLCHRIKNAIRYKYWDFRARCQRFKHGYAYIDVWEMFNWFITTIRPMLVHLRDHGCGVPIEFENNEKGWYDTLTDMISCLDMMDEDKVKDSLGFDSFDKRMSMTKKDYEKYYHTMENNKNRFFELFSAYFYNLWD